MKKIFFFIALIGVIVSCKKETIELTPTQKLQHKWQWLSSTLRMYNSYGNLYSDTTIYPTSPMYLEYRVDGKSYADNFLMHTIDTAYYALKNDSIYSGRTPIDTLASSHPCFCSGAPGYYSSTAIDVFVVKSIDEHNMVLYDSTKSIGCAVSAGSPYAGSCYTRVVIASYKR